MSRSLILSIVFIIALTFMVSCSGGDGNLMTTPAPTDRDTVATPTPGTTACFGLWQIVIDPATGTGDIVQLRNADKILNVLGFMEPPPLSLMDLDWPALVIDDPVIKVGVILTHPIDGDPVFTGFDVRGVCFGPEVTNADGLTIIPGPEYFSGVPFGYQDGLLGAPDSVGDFKGLAGYKYYCDGLDADEDLAAFMSNTDNLDDRGSFGDGETNQRDYILDWTDSDHAFFIFNYAIYANYDWPVGDPPITLDNFEITTANSAEAFCADFTELASSLYYAESTSTGGGSISLQVELWDWQGDISNVTIESVDSGIMAQTGYNVALGAFPNGYSYGYEFYDVAATPTSVGDLDLLITVTDSKTFGEYWFLDLLESTHDMYNEKIYNCFIYTANVIDCPPPTVTSIDPTGGLEGAVIDDAEITGTFMDGSLLAVTLKKAGEPDIACTDAAFVNGTTITCDIPLGGATLGVWDVEVTNGCGTLGTLAAGFTVALSKNIALRSGVNAHDLAIDHADGDLLILYSDGQVWRYTEGGFYQDGAFLYTTSTACEFIDVSPNSYSICGGNRAGTSLYSRSYTPTGGTCNVHTMYENGVEVGGFTGTSLNNYHFTITGYYYLYPNRVWINRFAPTSYGGGSGNIPGEGTGYNRLDTDYIRGCESSTESSYIYFVESGPEYRVERYNHTLSYTGVNWGGTQTDGMGGFNNPLDITRDDNNDYYILDELSTTAPLVKKYSSSGAQIGSFGNSTLISGTPLRIEGGDYNGNIIVLHGDGLSIFLPGEM